MTGSLSFRAERRISGSPAARGRRYSRHDAGAVRAVLPASSSGERIEDEAEREASARGVHLQTVDADVVDLEGAELAYRPLEAGIERELRRHEVLHAAAERDAGACDLEIDLLDVALSVVEDDVVLADGASAESELEVRHERATRVGEVEPRAEVEVREGDIIALDVEGGRAAFGEEGESRCETIADLGGDAAAGLGVVNELLVTLDRDAAEGEAEEQLLGAGARERGRGLLRWKSAGDEKGECHRGGGSEHVACPEGVWWRSRLGPGFPSMTKERRRKIRLC